MNAHNDQTYNLNDLAKLALAMYDHASYFLVRHKLRLSFSRDFNGGGNQYVFIKREDDKAEFEGLVKVFFSPTYRNDGEFLYEADLFTDQDRDYKPTLNRGKHRFIADSAVLNIDWNSDEMRQWRSDVERLTKSFGTLSYWTENDMDMRVTCVSAACHQSSRIPIIYLKKYEAMGVTLEDLKARLKCSKCGKRDARTYVYR